MAYWLGIPTKDLPPGKILKCKFYLSDMNSLKNYPKLDAQIKIEGHRNQLHRSRGFVFITPEGAMESLIECIGLSPDEDTKQQLILDMHEWLKNKYSKVSALINVERSNKKELELNSGNYWKTSTNSDGETCLPLLQYNSNSELIKSVNFNMGSHETVWR